MCVSRFHHKFSPLHVYNKNKSETQLLKLLECPITTVFLFWRQHRVDIRDIVCLDGEKLVYILYYYIHFPQQSNGTKENKRAAEPSRSLRENHSTSARIMYAVHETRRVLSLVIPA